MVQNVKLWFDQVDSEKKAAFIRGKEMEEARLANANPSRANSMHGGVDAGD